MEQKTREVVLYSVSDDETQKIYTKATTWQELIDTCPIAKKVLDGKSAVIRGETNTTIDNNNQKLPEESFTVMFHVKKVSAGVTPSSALIIELNKLRKQKKTEVNRIRHEIQNTQSNSK